MNLGADERRRQALRRGADVVRSIRAMAGGSTARRRAFRDARRGRRRSRESRSSSSASRRSFARALRSVRRPCPRHEGPRSSSRRFAGRAARSGTGRSPAARDRSRRPIADRRARDRRFLPDCRRRPRESGGSDSRRMPLASDGWLGVLPARGSADEVDGRPVPGARRSR